MCSSCVFTSNSLTMQMMVKIWLSVMISHISANLDINRLLMYCIVAINKNEWQNFWENILTGPKSDWFEKFFEKMSWWTQILSISLFDLLHHLIAIFTCKKVNKARINTCFFPGFHPLPLSLLPSPIKCKIAHKSMLTWLRFTFQFNFHFEYIQNEPVRTFTLVFHIFK